MNYIYNEELYHHGIKGQKWGLRRYQYEDMSLTPEGREHYGVGPPDGSAAAREGGSSSSSKSATASATENASPKDKFWTDERKATAKKVAIAGAAVAGTALVAYGAYKLGEQKATASIDIGREMAAGIQPQKVTLHDVIDRKIDAHFDKKMAMIDAKAERNIQKRRAKMDAKLEAQTQAYKNKLIRKEKKKELKREYKALKDANKRELKIELEREKAKRRAEQKQLKQINKDMDSLQNQLARDMFIDKDETSRAVNRASKQAAKIQKTQERANKINSGKQKVNGFLKTTAEYTDPVHMQVYNDIANDFLNSIYRTMR